MSHQIQSITEASPLAGYQHLVAEGTLSYDPAQEEAAARLDTLFVELSEYSPTQRSGWRALFRRENNAVPKGIYIHGGVGRGKSMLMDLFFDTTSFEPRRRVHFHAFMLEVHETIHRWRKLDNESRKAEGFDNDDPIPPLARKIADEAMLLCFDEFQISDVADAMILGRLFGALLDAGVVMVVTSNRHPDDLYKGGLNRRLFLPTIEMLETRLDLVHLASPTDYRIERIKGMPVYHMPLGEKAVQELDDCFEALTGEVKGSSLEIMVRQGRTLEVPRAAKGVARFEFAELCERPLGATDYLAIADNFHTLILANIPQLGSEKRNEARRFVALIDTLYDQRIKLVCSAEVEPESLYPDGDGHFEFARTISRLNEMQSHHYFEMSRSS